MPCYILVDLRGNWVLVLDTFEFIYFEHKEIPFFLFTETEVVSLYLFGIVFLFDTDLFYLKIVYFLLEFAVFKLFEVE